MAADLHSLGRKAQKEKSIFPKIDKKLIHHFIRGLFDGDGSVSINDRGYVRYSIIGAKNVINIVSNIVGGNVNSHGNTWRIETSGNHKAKFLHDFLYKDCTLYLDRKRKILSKAKPKYNLKK